MLRYPPGQETVERELKHYLNDDKMLYPALSLYASVYKVQREWIAAFSETRVYSEFAEAAVDRALEGTPLLESNPIVIDAALLTDLLSRLAQSAGNVKDVFRFGEDVSALCSGGQAAAFFSDPANLSEEKVLLFLGHTGIDLSSEKLDALSFLIQMAVKPFYVRYAEFAAQMYDLKLWDKGVCPVCGQKPMIAVLSKENGARILECGLCHTNWEFYRLVCPSCGNNDQEFLRFFFMPKKQYRRVYVCEKCKFYLKTTVLKDLGREVVPDLENVATVYLDFLAHEEGYGILGSSEVN